MYSENMIRLLVAFSFAVTATAQNAKPTTDESLIDRPNEAIDLPGCYSDLNKADRNGDGFVKSNEYLNFIQEYGKRICFSTDSLTLQQTATFNTLACICQSQENATDDCCLGANAQIPTAGSLLPAAQQTPNQNNYLTSVCKLTDATIDGQCQTAATTPGINTTNSTTTDESLIDRPNEAIDLPGCYSDLNKADRNGDGFVKSNEYLNFIQEYGKRICFSTDSLTLQQTATFNTLACICQSQENATDDCCLGANAQIPTAGSLLPAAQQTPNQNNYLTSVCKLTDATIDGQCQPAVTTPGINTTSSTTPNAPTTSTTTGTANTSTTGTTTPATSSTATPSLQRSELTTGTSDATMQKGRVTMVILAATAIGPLLQWA